MEVMIFRNAVLLGTLAFSLLAADGVVTEAKKKLADKKYDEAIAQLETAYKAKPQPDVKKALVEANLEKADSFMNNAAVPPRVKYPTALKAYREVLKYDKDNKKAKENIDTIEGIYKSMGRPVPQ
jgi:tetratricopeptide (TPR) repeat protein